MTLGVSRELADDVLLGPRGLFAIEVKHLNGTVHVNGDDWRSDKYDQYGNLVGQGRRIADARGRSPSAQLNEPASELRAIPARARTASHGETHRRAHPSQVTGWQRQEPDR